MFSLTWMVTVWREWTTSLRDGLTTWSIQEVGMFLQIILLLTLLFIFPGGLYGQEGWVDRRGNQEENSDSKKWRKNFGGWLVATSDSDWRWKWNNPEGDVPVFTETEKVKLGSKITLLTLFKNPLPDLNNHIDISCDITVFRPDGTSSFFLKDMDCGAGELNGKRNYVRLAPVVIDFVGELGDPFGLWRVEVLLRDKNAQVELLLRKEFELVNDGEFIYFEFPERRGPFVPSLTLNHGVNWKYNAEVTEANSSLWKKRFS